MNKLISVIIPIFNVEKFLAACIDSVLNQTYENIEIILIDDGSTDTCPQICDEYEKKDSRVTVIHKENGGISSARNAGLDASHGEYIYFLDGDDYIDKYTFEILMKPILKNPEVDISIGGFEKVSDLDTKKQDEYSNLLNSDINQFKEIRDYKTLFNIKLWMVVWGKLIRKNLFDGLYFPEGKLHEDEFITYRLYDKSKKLFYYDKSLYKYCQHEHSIMHNISPKMVENKFECFTEALNYYNSQKNYFCQHLFGRRLYSFMNNIYFLSKENTDIDFKYYEKRFLKQSFKYLHLKTKIKYLVKRTLIILNLI